MSSSRDAILNKVKSAVKQVSHNPESPANIEQNLVQGLKAATPTDQTGLVEQFKKEIEKVSGECHIVASQKMMLPLLADMLREMDCSKLALDSHPLSRQVGHLLQQTMPQLELVDAMTLDYQTRRAQVAKDPAGLVVADYGLADSGTLVALYDKQYSNMAHFLPSTIFTILPAGNLIPNLFDLFANMNQEKAKNMVLITGPSRTADIEKIIILGAHGPKRLVVFILEG